jgi:hypothetical protein
MTVELRLHNRSGRAGVSGAGRPVKTSDRCRGWARLAPAGFGLLLAAWLFTPAAEAAGDPRSSLDRPLGPGPIFILGSVSAGGASGYDDLRLGYGATLLFRPHAAADFFGPLFDWNTAMVLQADYRPVADRRRLLAADFILRRYLRDMRVETGGATLFAGLGVGGAEVTFPAGEHEDGQETWFSYLAEFGYECTPIRGWLLCLKAQLRLYAHNDRDYSNWSTHIALGIPIFW